MQRDSFSFPHSNLTGTCVKGINGYRCPISNLSGLYSPMSDSPPILPAANPDIPEFAALAADPEIAPLLGFVPVPRQVKRPNGWTDDLQRELIARLAVTGTLQQAVWQMGKHATGAESLYKTASADSFRASWDQAVAIGRRRQGHDSGPPHSGPVPGITRRSRRSWVEPDPVDPEAEEMDEDGR